MDNQLIVSPSPHLHGGDSTRRLMRDVLIALAPAFLLSAWIYGWNVLIVTGVSVASCLLFEYLIGRFMLRKKSTLDDLSAVVTGMLLAFNLPSTLPLWMVALGALVAIGIGKMSFGGLGRNLFNPALVGRVFLLISFPAAMTSFPIPAGVDALSGATPLAIAKWAFKGGIPIREVLESISWKDYLIGFKAGSLGEIAALPLLLGFLYLLIRKVVSWHIPVFVLGTMALCTGILWAVDPLHCMSPLFHLLTGGAILGAVFMATDYVTSPMTAKGMAIFGIGIGVITALIRLWGAYPEGISFAILIMNATVPLIDKYIKPRRFGTVKAVKKEEASWRVR